MGVEECARMAPVAFHDQLALPEPKRVSADCDLNDGIRGLRLVMLRSRSVAYPAHQTRNQKAAL